jgi:hypothetical protein
MGVETPHPDVCRIKSRAIQLHYEVPERATGRNDDAILYRHELIGVSLEVLLMMRLPECAFLVGAAPGSRPASPEIVA